MEKSNFAKLQLGLFCKFPSSEEKKMMAAYNILFEKIHTAKQNKAKQKNKKQKKKKPKKQTKKKKHFTTMICWNKRFALRVDSICKKKKWTKKWKHHCA